MRILHHLGLVRHQPDDAGRYDQHQVPDKRHGRDDPDFTDRGRNFHIPGPDGRTSRPVIAAMASDNKPDLRRIRPINSTATDAILGILRLAADLPIYGPRHTN